MELTIAQFTVMAINFALVIVIFVGILSFGLFFALAFKRYRIKKDNDTI